MTDHDNATDATHAAPAVSEEDRHALSAAVEGMAHARDQIQLINAWRTQTDDTGTPARPWASPTDPRHVTADRMLELLPPTMPIANKLSIVDNVMRTDDQTVFLTPEQRQVAIALQRGRGVDPLTAVRKYAQRVGHQRAVDRAAATVEPVLADHVLRGQLTSELHQVHKVGQSPADRAAAENAYLSARAFAAQTGVVEAEQRAAERAAKIAAQHQPPAPAPAPSANMTHEQRAMYARMGVADYINEARARNR